jgi:hypothetical protein
VIRLSKKKIKLIQEVSPMSIIKKDFFSSCFWKLEGETDNRLNREVGLIMEKLAFGTIGFYFYNCLIKKGE